MRLKIGISIFISLFLLSCQTGKPDQLSSKPVKGIPYFTEEIPKAKQLEFYNFDSESSIDSRIVSAPQELLNLVDQAPLMKNLSINLENANISQREKDIITGNFEYLPEFMKQFFRERVVLISVIDNYPGGGGVDYIFDEQGKEYFVILVNKSLFEVTLAEAMFYINYTYFKPEDDTFVTFDFGREHSSILWFLIHETAHCLDYTYNITHVDTWDKEVSEYGITIPAITIDFTGKIWDSQTKIKDFYSFSYIDRVNQNFTGSADPEILSAKEIDTFYTEMLQTPFVTPYAAYNSMDDFAEFFAFFHLTQHLGCDYVINLEQNENVLSSYEPMKSREVKQRFPLMDIFYEDYSDNEYRERFGI